MVKFKPGKNHLRVLAGKDGVTVTDEIEFEYQTAKWGKPARLALAEIARDAETATIEATLFDAERGALPGCEERGALFSGGLRLHDRQHGNVNWFARGAALQRTRTDFFAAQRRRDRCRRDQRRHRTRVCDDQSLRGRRELRSNVRDRRVRFFLLWNWLQDWRVETARFAGRGRSASFRWHQSSMAVVHVLTMGRALNNGRGISNEAVEFRLVPNLFADRDQPTGGVDLGFCDVVTRPVCGECAERWSTTQVASVGKVLRQSLIARQYLWLLRPTFGGGCHRKCPHPISRRYWSSLVPFPLLALPSVVHLKTTSRRESLINSVTLMTYSRKPQYP